MKVIAINGSPRKSWNTATLIENALEGARSHGAETSLVHLYDLTYKGCTSCFACKIKGGKSYGVCAIQDDLTPVYREIREVDALLIGSPIYFGNVTGELRSFIERLLFPYLVYSEPPRSLFHRRIRTAWIYTMNVPERVAQEGQYGVIFEANEMIFKRIFGPSQSLMSYDTLQFADYSKVTAEKFDVAAKEKRRMDVFPNDCRKAYSLGATLVCGTEAE